MPDFCQANDNYGELPSMGRAYCAPVAASNVLFFLSRSGFQNLIAEDTPEGQYKLIKLLGSKDYMKTSDKTGTEPIDLMKGLEKYVVETGYDVLVLWRGWHKGGNYTTGDIATPDWVSKKLEESFKAILHIGWYKHDAEKDLYERKSGHFVSVYGIKLLEDGNYEIKFHDPSIRSGIEPKEENCITAVIDSGKLSKWDKYPERDAIGHYKVSGIKLKEGTDTAIIDGTILFKVF